MTAATVLCQRHKRAAAWIAAAEARSRAAGSASKRAIAMARAAGSSGGTNAPASGGTIDGIAPADVPITGRPRIRASA
jgi:hypothetical protein